jgi:outer membrane receptor protein involved in Fe transport
VRGDYTSLVGGISVDPQLGLVLDLDDLGRLRGALSRGYRAPNLYESFYAQLAQINQPQLHGEHSETAEVSFEHYLGTHSRAQAIVYRQRINDLIELTNTGDVLQFTNAGTSIAYGAELELEARWDELRLRANYAYTHARDGADQPRANAPRSVATVTMMLPLPVLRGAVLALETHYLGARRTLTGSEIASAFSSSAALTLRNIGGGLDLAIGARNVFDARTSDPGTNGHREAAIPQDPRTVWVGVTGKLPGM